jgi:1,4-dihydroxy-2-naphthoyl-CoA hydrolase
VNDLARSSMPFCAALGITTHHATAGQVVLTIDWSPEHCTVMGAMHGGALMSLADSAGAICAFLNLPEGAAGTSTIQSSTNLVASVRHGQVTATATPLHIGRSTIVVGTELHNDGQLVAITTQTQTVLNPQ